MPIQLNQDARLNELWLKLHTESTGFRTRVEALLENALRSTTNLFGTAALLDTGTAEGNVPVLGTAASQLPASTIPALPASRFTGAFALGRIPNLDATDKLLTPTDFGTTRWGSAPGPGIASRVGRILVSQLPRSIPAEAFTFGTVSEARLPQKGRQITTISGTCVRAAFTYDVGTDTASNLANPSASYTDPGGTTRRNVTLVAGAPPSVGTTNLPGGSASVIGSTLRINAVLPTLVGTGS